MSNSKADSAYRARRQELAGSLGKREVWEFVDHWPLYSGIRNLARCLAITDLFRSTLDVPGDVAEFGVWRGANTMLITKTLTILDFFGPKVVHCFDSFAGLQAIATQDGPAIEMRGQYLGSYDELQSLIDLDGLDGRINIHIGLIEETLPAFTIQHPETMFSFVYCDTDLYLSTKVILEVMWSRLNRGGLIVFDEWNRSEFPGEGVAVNDFLRGCDDNFELVKPPNTEQPTLAIRKLC